jgi:hypothetical protein
VKPLARAALRVFLVASLAPGVSCSSSGSGPGARLDAGTAPADAAPDGGDASQTGDLAMDGSPDAAIDATGVGAVLRWPDTAVGEVAVAATNDTLAVVYVENVPDAGTPSQSRLMLQLLNGDLKARGAAREIDRQVTGDIPPIPSVATNGTSFLLCWSPTDQVRCLGADGSSSSPALFQTGGVTPTVAFQGQAWALAYVASPQRSQMNEVRVVRIPSDGAPPGEPAVFPYDAYFSRPVPFVSTPSGFALLAGQPTLSLYRLDAQLAVQGTPVDTGLGSWAYRSLAATDDEAAMGLAKPYGNVLVHIRGSEVVLHQDRGCGEKGGCDTAVALQGDTFAVAWWSTGGQVSFYPDIDHAGTPLDVLASTRSPLTLVPFRSQLIVVSRGVP